MEVIEEKVEAGGKEIEEKPKKAPKPTKVIDLVSVLQKSLEETGGKKKTAAKSHKKQKAASKESSVTCMTNDEIRMTRKSASR